MTASTMKDTLGVLLAGGAGERLYPLTRDRAKPAVTFGGNYRISNRNTGFPRRCLAPGRAAQQGPPGNNAGQ